MLYAIQIDRIDEERRVCVGFVGPVGGPGWVESAAAGAQFTQAEGLAQIERLTAMVPSLILSLVAAPAAAGAGVGPRRKRALLRA